MASGETVRPSAEQLRQEIERTREQLATSVVALRREVSVRTDWREWVRRKPGVVLGAAFAIGLYVGFRD